MEYPSTSQVAQPPTYQEVFDMSHLDWAWSRNFRCYRPYDLAPCHLNHQCSLIHTNPICNSIFMDSQPLETWGNALGFPGIVPDNSLLPSQPAVQNTVTEQSGGDQDLKQVVSNLEGRMDRLAEVIESLRNEVEEKTRFFAEIELYINRLVEWTKDSKQATNTLVAELKEAVDVAKSK